MKFWVPFFIFFLLFNVVFAYSSESTHPALTDEIIDLFNLYHPELKISDEFKELTKKGSVEEDNNIRSMHHFYDPVYNRGIEVAGTKWQSSKEWAEDTMGQASLIDQAFAGSLTNYFSSDTDHSWNRAIYEYTWGSKERGLTDLGHILHLIEDMSVPDHTRNDAHPPLFHFGSPYEAWTAQFDAEKIEGLAKSLFNSKLKPVAKSDLQGYFNSMANYSNNNFFSKDTTPDKNNEYQKPKQGVTISETLKNGIIASFIYSNNPNDFFRLALVKIDFIQNKKEYFVKDDDFLILSDYWDRLSKQAVLHGAGAVKLFFDEVEKEKQNKVLFNKNKSWLLKAYDAAKNKIFGVAATFYGSSLGSDDLAELNNTHLATVHLAAELLSGLSGLPSEQSSPTVQQQELAFVPSPNRLTQVNDFSKSEVGGEGIEESPFALNKGEGGEGVGGGNLGVGLLSGSSGSSFNTPRVAPENDNVATTFSIISSVSSSTPDVLPVADTTPPNITFFVTECSSSISSDGCLVVNPNLSIFWSSTSTDIASYDVECSLFGSSCPNFSFSTTPATSTNYFLPTDEKIYQFRARARDTAGNVSNWSEINVEYFSFPVVINEVAWAGTIASSADEWVELFNKTGKTISLSGWVLRAQDQVPYINLSGTISANSYYLIERTNDNTVSDITADLITAFSGPSVGGGGSGLSNFGEVLILSKAPSPSSGQASTTIDQTVLCSNAWCGGTSSVGNLSMERVNPNISGTDTTNWGNMNYLVTRNGKDANNLPLNATPRRRNSLNYLISQTSTLGSNKTLTKSKSPYVIPTSQDFVVSSGVTLTIEPGTVIKMGDQSSIIVSGNIISAGTASDMITFTSIYDDSYAGDTNGDGFASLPTAGNWKYLIIQSPSQNSEINYTRFKYGGRYFSFTALDARAMVSIYEATTTISNSIFEESQIVGLRTTRFNGQISGSLFSTGTTTNADKVGLYIHEGAPTISGNTFSKNYTGLTLENTAVNLSNLTFSNNYLGIQSALSTINILTPGSVTFTNNSATTSPKGLF